MEEGNRVGPRPAAPQSMAGAEADFLGGVVVYALDDLGGALGWRFIGLGGVFFGAGGQQLEAEGPGGAQANGRRLGQGGQRALRQQAGGQRGQQQASVGHKHTGLRERRGNRHSNDGKVKAGERRSAWGVILPSNLPLKVRGRSIISPYCIVVYSLSNGRILDLLSRMDSQSRQFESPLESHPIAAPLPCPRAMQPQTITVATPFSILGTLLMALLTVPRMLVMVPVLNRRRRA